MKFFSILSIKILALYLVLKTLYSFLPVLLSGHIYTLFTPELLLVLSATIALPIIGGIVLWHRATYIANSIHQDETPIKVSEHEIISAGLFLVGITLIINHIGIFINDYMSMGHFNYGSLFIIAVSLLLVFGRRSFKR